MTLLAHIGRDIDKQIITAIVAPGQGQRVLEKLSAAPGVLSVSHHHARGVGKRIVKKGQLFFNEMDVLILLVETEFAEKLFAAVFSEAGIGTPGGGMIFSESVLRGHPMLPFDGADW
jgi:nitrogen regulatory protein PII